MELFIFYKYLGEKAEIKDRVWYEFADRHGRNKRIRIAFCGKASWDVMKLENSAKMEHPVSRDKNWL
jgi:hypothetical protein